MKLFKAYHLIRKPIVDLKIHSQFEFYEIERNCAHESTYVLSVWRLHDYWALSSTIFLLSLFRRETCSWSADGAAKMHVNIRILATSLFPFSLNTFFTKASPLLSGSSLLTFHKLFPWIKLHAEKSWNNFISEWLKRFYFIVKIKAFFRENCFMKFLLLIFNVFQETLSCLYMNMLFPTSFNFMKLFVMLFEQTRCLRWHARHACIRKPWNIVLITMFTKCNFVWNFANLVNAQKVYLFFRCIWSEHLNICFQCSIDWP